MEFSRGKIYILVGVVVGIIVLGFGLAKFGGRRIDINGGIIDKTRAVTKSPLSGTECENGNSRPFAVMVSSDKEARPLSGIGEADLVFEMPVVENGFTRMMAVYQCGRPKEVGSVRSARLDFLPLALGLDAIYVHFGGEREVLQKLNNGVIDNIDGLKYDEIYYYRKKGIPRPHNAFTDFGLLAEASRKLGHNLTEAKIDYPHETKSKSQSQIEPTPLFNEEFQVTWRYDKSANSYFRGRSGSPEIDKNAGEQVAAKNVIIMRTTWSPINKDYIRVKTVGSGGLILYKNGTVVTGTWEKKDDRARLGFFDQNHREIPLAAGITWVEIDAR